MDAVPLGEIEAARERIRGTAIRTPLVRLDVEDAPAQIYLKLENLQPTGAFKIRSAANALLAAAEGDLAAGVWTASAGNMAQGVALCARRLGLPCAVVLPENAPETKRSALRRLGADVVQIPVAEWFEIFETHEHDRMTGVFVHAFDDPLVIAGNGTIGLELLEDLPDVDAVLVPFGGGGLAAGVASALRALRPEVRVYACEIATGAALAASLEAGRAVRVAYEPSFVDGIGSPDVLPRMFELAAGLLDGSVVVGLEETAAAVRLLAERARVVAEGAGAVPVAAVLSGRVRAAKVACIVSGGNIDATVLAAVLRGATAG